MGFFDDLADLAGDVVEVVADAAEVACEAVGIVCGIAVAPIALALDISIDMVAVAVEAGCRTVEEVRDFYDND